MKRFYVFLVALWVASFAMAQSDVSGQVIDEQGEPLIGVCAGSSLAYPQH